MSKELLLRQTAFIAEVTSLSAAGSSIATDSNLTHGSEELPTCKGYVDQHKRIIDMISLYRELIQKDASDLTKMGNLISKVDTEISISFNK
jgi:hypothetical protein